ncbi:MAG: hypothetical protein IK032_05785 [Bacteroidales bacterium]|nr:hypothetical protein [Bacteroidales bacterium]
MKKGFCIGAIVVSLALLSMCGAVAQNYQEIRAIGTFPIGNFGRVGQTAEMFSESQLGSGSAIGAGLGYRYSFDLSMGITFIVGGDVFWNMTNSTYRRICYENYAETAPHYLNMPFSIGVGLSMPLGKSQWSFFFDVTAGVNIHYTTSTGWRNFEVQYSPALSPALSTEAAIRYKKVSLGVQVLSLGSPTMKVSSGEENFSSFPAHNQKRNMLMGNVVVSYKLSKHKKEWKPARQAVFDM